MPPPTTANKPNSKLTAAPKKSTNGTANGNASASTAPADAGTSDKTTSAGKPDQAKYNSEQDALNKEIADVKAKLDAVRSRISLSQAPGSSDRRSVLKTEMDALRGEQGKYKADRSKILDEVKRLQESVGKKIKDAQAQRGKQQFKNVGEIDQRINALNSQIESGSMKLVDEKKALAEISSLRRSRKTLESSGSIDDSIAADRAKIDELKKLLDDPESKKVSDKFDQLKKEMDGLREEGNKAYEERNKLFDERNALSAKMDELYGKKRDSAQQYREEKDRYWTKVQADRQARQDRFKAEKAKEDAARQVEEISRLREEAKMPAYAGEIEDCNVLVGWFKGKYGGGEVPSTNAGGKGTTAQVQGVKELEIRKVENDFAGMTLKKKGGDEELDGMFGGSQKGKKKGKKAASSAVNGSSGVATPASESATSAAAGGVNLPMSLLSALLALGIPPPSSKDDVQRTVDDLETKKAWFEANSQAKTKAEIERVEKLVTKMQKKNALLAEGGEANDDEIDEEAVADAEEHGGRKEPLHTVAVGGEARGEDIVEENGEQLPSDAKESGELKKVDSELEEVKEAQS
ncbi:hypothetical protein BD324DRAFT_623892 [Kockovaella imperatae]|uniref:Nuclear segregation protein Bfr1 n=1 Tax=Kockovaella imperatae TaxID=4999 RepID=A0A1Y1UIR5_9TREE|nr:hypothetical protein BD324DRAFT_623892 [Kockovaella imperatae]ORX37940.1 hypothetical protein BD324DRAFT_623892 [Kockovaella imperatae]